MTKEIEEYYWEAIDNLEEMIEPYREYGYSPELRPLVKALEKAKAELTDQLTSITQQRLLTI